MDMKNQSYEGEAGMTSRIRGRRVEESHRGDSGDSPDADEEALEAVTD